MRSTSLNIIIAIALTSILLFSISSYSISGFFSKAFDKSLSPGEQYERNITIRKYYNLTVRFQKEGSTSYLGFNDEDSIIVLRAGNGSVIKNVTGVINGKHYIFAESEEVRAITKASAFSIENYEDVINQSVSVSYIGTKAYITITVTYKTASISGYIIDDLTGETVDGIHIYAFPDGSNPQTAEAIIENVSRNGKYLLTINLNSSMPLDIYVKDYDVS